MDEADNEYGVLSPANGELLAEVSDDLKLTVVSPKLFFDVFHAKEIRYITLDEYAELVGRGRNIVGRMCRNGRIPGARQQGSRWLIPEDAPYPASLKNNEERALKICARIIENFELAKEFRDLRKQHKKWQSLSLRMR